MRMIPAVLASSKCFALGAELNGKYLQYVYCNQAAGSSIEASAGTVVANARTRFLVERLEEEEEGLMHVRCCYNNKYWKLYRSTRVPIPFYSRERANRGRFEFPPGIPPPSSSPVAVCRREGVGG